MTKPHLFGRPAALALFASAALLAACTKDDDTTDDTPPDAAAPGPCGGATARCADASTAETCVVPTDGMPAFVARRTCAPTEECRVDGDVATCAPKGDCAEGATSCADDATLRTCKDGRWTPSRCATRCKGNALGAACVPDIPLASVKGRLAHEVRRPNAAGAGLDPATTEASKGMLLLSYHQGVLVDAQVTSAAGADAGAFAIDVAAQPADGDFVGAVPVSLEPDRVLFGVADHGIPQDVVDATQLGALIGQAPPTAKLWGWKWAVTTLGATPSLTITEAQGSAAAHMYRVIFDLFESAKQVYPTHRARSLIAWFRRGVSYEKAGPRAAFFAVPNDPQGVKFDSQFVVGDDATADVWDDDIVIHELGHYWMWTHSVLPGEGGPHVVFQKSLPGLAWSEGFANWMSLVAKGAPTFDFDITKPDLVDFAAGSGTATADGKIVALRLDPTTPDKGLIQGISEAEVTQVLWRLSSGPKGPRPLLEAIATPRMTTPPFGRGYTRRAPTYDANGNVTGYADTGVSAPMLADFLDALECSGFDRALVDAAVEPTARYPYPSASPVCK